MTGSGLPASFEMFVTSASRNCESVGTVSASSITLPARSVVTLQAGGTPLAGSNSARAGADAEGANTKQIAKLEGVTIYPNPTNGVVSVATGEAKAVKATISTLHGIHLNLKAKQLGAGNLSFDISGQPAGIYLLRVEADGKGGYLQNFHEIGVVAKKGSMFKVTFLLICGSTHSRLIKGKTLNMLLYSPTGFTPKPQEHEKKIILQNFTRNHHCGQARVLRLFAPHTESDDGNRG
jgi:hypothetical protein